MSILYVALCCIKGYLYIRLCSYEYTSSASLTKTLFIANFSKVHLCCLFTEPFLTNRCINSTENTPRNLMLLYVSALICRFSIDNARNYCSFSGQILSSFCNMTPVLCVLDCVFMKFLTHEEKKLCSDTNRFLAFYINFNFFLFKPWARLMSANPASAR